MKLGQSVHYDMEDLLEQANEIQETLGRSYAVPDELDEADLQAGAFVRSLQPGDAVLTAWQSWMHWSWTSRRRVLRT